MENALPRTVDEVFADFKGRRAGLIKALTVDVVEFYRQCDPEKDNLCLYGLPNETWEVSLPVDEVPPELPEPALGVNFARDGMQDKDWLSLVAVQSDSWLLSVAFYFGARFGFGRNERRELFDLINDLPTVFESVSGTAKQPKEQSVPYSNKSKSRGKTTKKQKMSPLPSEEEDSEEENEGEIEEEDGEQDNTQCGTCGKIYKEGEFWILCDICEDWFHGECVKITEAKAEHIKQYKCPTCSGKRARV